MLDTLKKVLFTGVGAASMTREKIEELGERLVKEGEVSEKEGKKFINDLLQKSSEARKNIEKMVQNRVEDTMKKFDIPTRNELKDLERRISMLENSPENNK